MSSIVNNKAGLVSSYVVQFKIEQGFAQYCNYFSESLEEIADLGVGYFGDKVSQDDDVISWVIKANFVQKPELNDIKNRVNLLCEAINMPKPELEMLFLEDVNWLEEVVKNSPPIETDEFYVYSDYNKLPSNISKIALNINPGMAFGTGHHQTTFLCLNALTKLYKSGFVPNSILDMGCGSGILAVAAAKLWPKAAIMAVDIEELSVLATIENAQKNNVEIQAFTGDGFNISQLDNDDRFDLILANILPVPLQDMAPALLAKIAKGGNVVLSGFTDTYGEKVISCYKHDGVSLQEVLTKENWQAAILRS